jgi:hypothetical protein
MRLASGPVWLLSTIEAYSKVERKPGRPRIQAFVNANTPVDEVATEARVRRERARVAAAPAGRVKSKP